MVLSTYSCVLLHVTGQTFSTPVNEEDLVKALTDHAHKIATTVLNQPGTGHDLSWDAQVQFFYCLNFGITCGVLQSNLNSFVWEVFSQMCERSVDKNNDLDFVLIEDFYCFSIICADFNYFMYLVCLFVIYS